MSKVEFKPHVVHISMVLGLVGGMSLCLGFSSVALHADQFFAKQIVCCCLSVLVSNCYYTAITVLQCLCSRTRMLRKKSAELILVGSGNSRTRTAFVDDMRSTVGINSQDVIMQHYTVQSTILQTIDFNHTLREIRLFVSREELWYMQYPMALASFILFFCIPMYNIACLLAMSIGFLARCIHDETKRGFLWKRDTQRTAVMVLMVLCAVLSVVTLCPIVTILNQRAKRASPAFTADKAVYSDQMPLQAQTDTNASAANETEVRTSPAVAAGTQPFLRQDDGLSVQNASDSYDVAGKIIDTTDPGTGHAPNYIDMLLHNDDLDEYLLAPQNSSVLADLLDAAQKGFREPSMPQKIVTWVVCFFVPFLLSSAPDSIRLPVVLEIMQPSMTCLAALLLCITLFVTEQENRSNHGYAKNIVLSVLSEWVTVVYIVVIPALIWMCTFLVIKCVRQKTLSFVCCALICFAYVRTLQVSANVHHHSRDITRTLIFVGALDVVYVILTIRFCRAENKAIQTGWDADREDDVVDDDDNFTATDDLHETTSPAPHYTMDDVLLHVTSEIGNTEDAMQVRKAFAAPARPRTNQGHAPALTAVRSRLSSAHNEPTSSTCDDPDTNTSALLPCKAGLALSDSDDPELHAPESSSLLASVPTKHFI